MAKKKKIAKLTEQQYYEYIMGLKGNEALFSPDGKVVVPDVFKEKDKKKDN